MKNVQSCSGNDAVTFWSDTIAARSFIAAGFGMGPAIIFKSPLNYLDQNGLMQATAFNTTTAQLLLLSEQSTDGLEQEAVCISLNPGMTPHIV